MDEKTLSQIKSGAKIKVFEKLKEGDKERISFFDGLVIARKRGSEIGATFTVRKVIDGIGVERVFPIHSPKITQVKILQSPRKVSRSKIYYVRRLSSRKIREKVG